jgi:hypothetical protein
MPFRSPMSFPIPGVGRVTPCVPSFGRTENSASFSARMNCRASVPDATSSELAFHRNALQTSSPLRRYAIRERIRVKISVITQARPGAVLFGRVGDGTLLTLCKVVPRIVSGDGEERPIGAFQVLH